MRRRESSVRFLASNGAMSQRTAKQTRRAARQARPPRRLARRRWLWASTVARWLAEDALKPWQHRSWIFPTDAGFLEKAGPVLDLYQGRWQGKLLHPGEFVICADEKPSIQAPAHPRDAAAGCAHARAASRAHLPAPRRAHLPGRARHRPPRRQTAAGLRPLRAQRRDRRLRPARLAGDDQGAVRLRAARLLIVDNCSSHRGQKAVDRLERRWPNLVLVHLPVHASWLNQIEIYVRHEAPCERRERTNNSQPCRLRCRPRADAAARRSWGQPWCGIARRRWEQPRQRSGRAALPDARVRASETERQSESEAVVEAP